MAKHVRLLSNGEKAAELIRNYNGVLINVDRVPLYLLHDEVHVVCVVKRRSNEHAYLVEDQETYGQLIGLKLPMQWVTVPQGCIKTNEGIGVH